MVKLVLVRHGESVANAANVYTGWNDVPLTEKGKKQAENAGKLIKHIPHFFRAEFILLFYQEQLSRQI